MKAIQIGKAFIINDYDGSEIERVSCYTCEQAADLCRRINSHEALVVALQDAEVVIDVEFRGTDGYCGPAKELMPRIAAALADAWK